MKKSMSTLPNIDIKSAEKLVAEMMAIPGKSAQEAKVLEFIRKRLRNAGIPSSAITTDTANKKSPLGGEVGNLIVKLPGQEKSVRVSSHFETRNLRVLIDFVLRGGRDAAGLDLLKKLSVEAGTLALLPGAVSR